MTTTTIEIIGFAAAVLGSISLIPEITKALKTHHLKDVAWGMLILSAFSGICWIAYGLHIQSYPILLSDTLHLSCVGLLIFLKIHYQNDNPPILAKESTRK